jgi:thiol-disulfide isomerase/thioredoxin
VTPALIFQKKFYIYSSRIIEGGLIIGRDLLSIHFISLILLGLLLFAAGCVEEGAEEGGETGEVNETGEAGESYTPADWRDYELVDTRTGETFRVSDFKGKSVLLETFAVWCPTCLKQQQEVKKMVGSGGNGVVHISLDVDPNEDEEIVRNHMESNGFKWYSAVAPPEMSQELIDEFGLTVVNAPVAPVILVCEDQSARLLEQRGVKPVALLEEEIEKGC